MAFLSDVKHMTAKKFEELCAPCINWILGTGIIVDGYKKILSYSSECIALLFAYGSIYIEGAALKIDYINDCELMISGTVNNIYNGEDKR